MTTRVPITIPALKLTGAVLLLLVGVLFATDSGTLAIAVVAAAALAVWSARDLLARERLAADETGVTVVTGFASHRHIPWAAIEKITVERRPHAGVRTETLEIDAGESVHVFSRHDLGAPPEDVADAITRIRASRHPA